MRLPSAFFTLLQLFLLCYVTQLSATDIWDGPAFSATAETLRHAAGAVKPSKDAEATVLLNEMRFTFDPAGRMMEVRHRIYRIENQEGVNGWSEISAQWAPWYQAKPEIKARTITTDGAVHQLDSTTLEDLPVHENNSDVYSDERKYGGPLPALASGAIVEYEVVLRETAPFFAGGVTRERSLAWSVPVYRTRLVLSHPESLPVRYNLQLLPEVSVVKSTTDNIETTILQQGPLPEYPDEPDHVPPDVVLFPAVEFTTGTSWQKVATEYARVSDPKLRLADVQSLIAKINVKDGTRMQVIRRIVAALHSNIRYTGVEFGESSLMAL